MFLDLFDTIKTSENHYLTSICRKNAVQGESMLYHLLLAGYTPTLTQTQVMDSNIIHNILRNNNDREHFLKMLQTQKIRLALYTGNGARSLQDYFKESLNYGVYSGTDFFDFSTMPFLKQYDSGTRRLLSKNIINSLEHNSYNFLTDGVSPEHTDYIGCLVEDIQDIDRAVKGRYIASKGFRKNIDGLFLSQCQSIIETQNIDSEFIRLCHAMMDKGDYFNRRSAYYNHIADLKTYYSIEDIEKMRQVVDNCYNEAVASSIDDEEYSMNLSSRFIDLIEPLQETGVVEKKEIIRIKPSREDKYLTWEKLSDIMSEVEIIEKEKKLSRIEALNKYKKIRVYKPIISVARYLGVGAITSFIPGVPEVVEIVSDLLSGAASDMVGEKLKKPSLKEVALSFADERNKSQVIDNSIAFISLTMQQKQIGKA